MRYRAADPATLRMLALDALTLIYHRASGITHIVDAPAPEILGVLAEPADLDEILARLSAEHDVIDADPAALAARLDELVRAGLVERL